MHQERVQKFLQKLDQLTEDFGIYIDLDYKSNVKLKDSETDEVLGNDFCFAEELGYECY